jgi:hypothetical protein
MEMALMVMSTFQRTTSLASCNHLVDHPCGYRGAMELALFISAC